MTDIKITKAVGGHKSGDKLRTSRGAAEYLINSGFAEAVEAEATDSERAEPKRRPKRAGGDSPAHLPTTAG